MTGMPLQKTWLFTLVAVAVWNVAGAAQSLADVARKEADRRKTIAEGGRVYTNKDLPNVPPPSPTSLPDTAADKDATGRTAAASGDQKPEADKAQAEPKKEPIKKDRAYWNQHAKDLRDQLDRDQTHIDALQSRVNALTTDFVNRDDPAQRAQIDLDRQKAIAELERLKKQIADDKRAIADFEEEARRGGVPPGWLR